jgi:hypothetical protein
MADFEATAQPDGGIRLIEFPPVPVMKASSSVRGPVIFSLLFGLVCLYIGA